MNSALLFGGGDNLEKSLTFAGFQFARLRKKAYDFVRRKYDNKCKNLTKLKNNNNNNIKDVQLVIFLITG